MDSKLFNYILLGFVALIAAGCIAMLVIAGTIHWNIFFYAFFPDYVSVPSVVLLTTSCFVIAISGLAVFGVLRNKSWVLKVFAGILCIFMIVQLAGGIIALSMEETLNDPLKNNMLEAFDNYNTSSADANIWNDVQREYYCCGVDSWKEWEDYGMTKIPKSCDCRVKEEKCEPIDEEGRSVYALGCFPRLRDYVHNLEVILGALAISFIAFELLAVVATFLISKANEPPRDVPTGDC